MKLAKWLIGVGVIGGVVAACGSSDSKKASRPTTYEGGGESSASDGNDGHAGDEGQTANPVGADGGAGPALSAAGNGGDGSLGERGGAGTSLGAGGGVEAGAGGEATTPFDDPTCGALGQSCCTGNKCDDLACLGGVGCSCAQAVFGRYILRSDGVALYQDETAINKQTAILLASTGLPLTGVTSVMEGYGFGCALLGADKTAWCWRTAANGNQSGQLGSGAVDSSGALYRATQVMKAANTPLTDVVGVSRDGTEGGNACAFTSTGELYCWGDATWLTNNGTTLAAPYATLITTDGVTPLKGVIQVALNYSYACALVKGASNREAWCWGYNYYGQLATGDTKARRYPTKVLGLADPSVLTTFGSYEYDDAVCALDGGKVRCWGNNDEGQVGNGNASSSVLSPSLVTLQGGLTPLTGVVDVRGGLQDNIRCNVCALIDSGDVMCWGTAFQRYPVSLGATTVVALGNIDGGYVRTLTSDGVYHGKKEDRMPFCGPL